MIARIPIAHIHGGEKTEGAFDESISHIVKDVVLLVGLKKCIDVNIAKLA